MTPPTTICAVCQRPIDGAATQTTTGEPAHRECGGQEVRPDGGQRESDTSQTATSEEMEEWEKENDEPHPIFEVDHRPERTQVVSGDVKFCPECGEDIPPENTEFCEDLVLNRYRTEFRCGDCGYHGEVLCHE